MHVIRQMGHYCHSFKVNKQLSQTFSVVDNRMNCWECQANTIHDQEWAVRDMACSLVAKDVAEKSPKCPTSASRRRVCIDTQCGKAQSRFTEDGLRDETGNVTFTFRSNGGNKQYKTKQTRLTRTCKQSSNTHPNLTFLHGQYDTCLLSLPSSIVL